MKWFKDFVFYGAKVVLFKNLQAHLFCAFLALSLSVSGATKTTTKTGNWSDATVWSPSGVPANTDDVVIQGGHTITVNGNYTCRNFDLGGATNNNTTLTISGTNTLTITGNVRINPNNHNRTMTLNANGGTINLEGEITHWSTTGTNTIRAAAGTLNFSKAVTISATQQNITLTAAGTINFFDNFTDHVNRLIGFAGGNINFYKNYTVNTTAASILSTSNVFFKDRTVVTANANLTLPNITVEDSLIFASASGVLTVAGNITLESGSTFIVNSDFVANGNWTNNGGTLLQGTQTIAFNANSKTVGGSASTAFTNIQIGSAVAASSATLTMSGNQSCNNLVFHAGSNTRTLTLNAGDTFTIHGNVTINQPVSNSINNTLSVGGGHCIINGNLSFVGTDNTASRVARVTVTSGSLFVDGYVNWMSNTVVATELISLNDGTIIFKKPIQMGSGSGSLMVTSTGSVYFDGTESTSLVFGGADAPSLTSTTGSKFYFKKGLTNNTNTLNFSSASQTYFTGNGRITPNANINFGAVFVNANAKDTIAAGAGVVASRDVMLAAGALLIVNNELTVIGNWENNGGNSGGSGTVIFNSDLKTISGSSATTFPNLQIGAGAGRVRITTNSNVNCNNLLIEGNANEHSLTLSVGTTLNVSGNVTIEQPTAGYNNSLAVGAGNCIVSGNLNFTGTANNSNWVGRVTVTTGNFTLQGYVSWMDNTAVSTEQITVGSGTVTFNNSLSMGSGTGTLRVTGAGSISFMGSASPSFTFGASSNAPVFSTVANSRLYFRKGFTNNGNPLALNVNSISHFTESASIRANANITFGSVEIEPSATDTIANTTGNVIIGGSVTLKSGSTLCALKNFQVNGNWTNNGGTFEGNTITVILNGNNRTIGGSTSTTFGNLQLGFSNINVVYTANRGVNCSNLIFQSANRARKLTLASGVALNISGNLEMNQNTDKYSNTLDVNAGSCTVAGNLNFIGTNNTSSRTCIINVTSGSFSLNGNLSWMSNTVTVTERFSVTSGTLNFANSLNMGSGTGRIIATSAAKINFNGTTAPSFQFGGATAPTFTTAFGTMVSFKNGFTLNTNTLTFAQGSTVKFTGNGTLTANAPLTLGNLLIDTGVTLTTIGNFSLNDNWTNHGTFTTTSSAVTFSGVGIQNLNKPGGSERFHILTTSSTGSTLKLNTDVMVTNTLNMTGSSINLNGFTLTVGDNAAATLTRSAGQVYGGVWKRWLPATAISGTTAPLYGLFPLGTANEYRPLFINSTSNPTSPGYIEATHTNSFSVENVSYTDNEGDQIELIAEMNSELTVSGLSGGTYNIDVKFTNFGSSGDVSNIKLLTYTSSVLGSVGNHATTIGPIETPTARRTGISASQLSNRWIFGTNNKLATPLYRYVYSRKSGNWNDTTAGNGTWSFTPNGPSCNCLPTGSGYVEIEDGHTVTVTANDSAKFIDILSGGSLVVNNARTLNVGSNVRVYEGASLNVAGTLNARGQLRVSGNATASGNVVLGYGINIDSAKTYTQTNGSLTIEDNAIVHGTLDVASGASIAFNGIAAEIQGGGTIKTASGGNIYINQNHNIAHGSSLTFGTSTASTNLNIASGFTVNNIGNTRIFGNIVGASSTSVWVNNAESELSITGALLTTGTLDASISPNVVSYCGSGAQNIKVPVTTYNVLEVRNSGTKSLIADIEADSAVVIRGTAVLNEGSFVLSGAAELVMSDTSELRLTRTTDLEEYPELRGQYFCTGGTVTITQNGDSAMLSPGPYFNLKLNGTRGYDISNVSVIANNLEVLASSKLIGNTELSIGGTFTHNTSATSELMDSIAAAAFVLSAGTVNAGEGILNITGAGGLSKTGGTFNAQSGKLMFSGNDTQTFSLNTASQTFANFCMNKTAGTLTPAGSLTSLTFNGNVELVNGTMNLGSVNAITFRGEKWKNDNATFNAGTSTITFSDTLDQSILGEASAQTFNNITINKTFGTVAAEGDIRKLNINGNLNITSGNFASGVLDTIAIAGNWTNAAGATFTPTAGTVLFNGSGAQAINGTITAHYFNDLNVRKTSGTLSVSGSATSLSLNGSMVLTSGTFSAGTAANIYVDNNWVNNGGTFTHGSSTVHFKGIEDQSIQGSATSQNFHHINLNKSSGTLSMAGSLDTLNINGNLTLASGDFDGGDNLIVLTSGNWTNNGGTFAPGSSTVMFTSTAGAQAINGSATSQSFNRLTVQKSGQTLSIGGSATSLTCFGNLTINAGTLNSGTANNIYLSRNFVNNGTFTQGTSTVHLNGSVLQTISGTTITTFNNLTLNNNSGSRLNRDVNVNGTLTLTSGNILSSSTNMLTLGTSALVAGGSDSSHVVGPMKKIGNSNFVFPVGKQGKMRKVGVIGLQSPATEIVAEFFNEPFSDTVTYFGTIDKVSAFQYWTVDRLVTSDSVKIRLYWEDAAENNIKNCDFLTIAHWTGAHWEEEPATADLGSVCRDNGSGSITTTGYVSTFSPFTFGGFGGGGALPVTLTDIKAKGLEKTILVEWTTAAEINNRGFEVQRSTDGENFTFAAWVQGNGTTAETNRYAFEDRNALPNVVYYYRLKQVDFDDAFEYSPMVSARITSTKAADIVWSKFIPNPASAQANLVIKAAAEGKADISIINLFGQQVFNSAFNIYNGLNNLSLDLSTLPAGYYIANIKMNGGQTSLRLVRE